MHVPIIVGNIPFLQRNLLSSNTPFSHSTSSLSRDFYSDIVVNPIKEVNGQTDDREYLSTLYIIIILKL